MTRRTLHSVDHFDAPKKPRRPTGFAARLAPKAANDNSAALPGEPVDTCPVCPEIARFAGHAVIEWTCPQCGAELWPECYQIAGHARFANAERELENLARWGVDLEGKSFDFEAHGNSGAPDVIHPGAMHVGDLQSLSEMMHAKGHYGAQPTGDRPERMDARSHDVRAAMATLRKLDAMVQTEDGTAHALVLLFSYWLNGPGSRDHWDNLTDEQLARVKEQTDGAYALSFAFWIGVVFTEADVREAWLRQGKLGIAFASKHGTDLLAAANEAWKGTQDPGTTHQGGRVHLETVRHQLGKLTQVARGMVEEFFVPAAQGRATARRAA